MTPAVSPLDRLWVAVDQAAAKDLESADYAELGQRQRAILRDALSATLDSCGERREDTPRWYPSSKTITEAKANSRVLRNLERRGLLVRLREAGPGGLQTKAVRLTLAGVRAARLDQEGLRAQTRLARKTRLSRARAKE